MLENLLNLLIIIILRIFMTDILMSVIRWYILNSNYLLLLIYLNLSFFTTWNNEWPGYSSDYSLNILLANDKLKSD